ncbi:MAG: hypothetical protein K2X77_06435 [Candidatus Obscuribacterales bacterium]|nr:hypothetical protein [Candidatus Obscuribacterales bacterium]
MKKMVPAIVCVLSLTTSAFADDGSKSASDQTRIAVMEQLDEIKADTIKSKARAENMDAKKKEVEAKRDMQLESIKAEILQSKALAERAEAARYAAAASMEKQYLEQVIKAKQELEFARIAAEKAEVEANIAQANARKTEALVRDMKAKAEMQTLEKPKL